MQNSRTPAFHQGIFVLFLCALAFASDHAWTADAPPESSPILTEFPTPTPGSGPTLITAGSDGALWFTEQSGNKIGRITTSGTVTEFPIPTPASTPYGIGAGPDGNIWFLEYS